MYLLDSQYNALIQRIEVLEKLVAEQADELVFLRKENQRLLKELRKYLNENTPSGSIPPYLKPALRNKVQEAMKTEEKEPKQNPRNSRPKEHDRERDITMKRCPCCGGTRLTKKKKSYFRTTIHIKLPLLEQIVYEYDKYSYPHSIR